MVRKMQEEQDLVDTIMHSTSNSDVRKANDAINDLANSININTPQLDLNDNDAPGHFPSLQRLA